MKKNKKGFTLIELLAVIVILGIIITIVVSNVVKYIGQSKQGAFKDAVGVFVKNVQTEIMANSITDANAGLGTDPSKYDYDKTNMKIEIKSATGFNEVIITGISGFASTKMDETGYCPAKASCKGNVVTLHMDNEGKLLDIKGK